MFLTGTLLNVATVLVGTLLGLLAGSRMPRRMQESLTTGLGFFTVVLGVSMAIRIFTDPDVLAPIFIRLADAIRAALG